MDLALAPTKCGSTVRPWSRHSCTNFASTADFLTEESVKATYAELSARGVEFRGEPQERPYGIEAMFRDNSGNWYSLNQPK